MSKNRIFAGNFESMNLLNKYIWLIDILNNAGEVGLTFEEIKTLYVNNKHISEGEEYRRRTFINHLNGIRDLFGLKIECRNRYHYRIVDDAGSDGQSYLRKMLFHLIAVNNVLTSDKDIGRRILLDDSRLEGTLPVWLTALKENLMVDFTFKPLWGKTTMKHKNFMPQWLKLIDHKWYIVGHSGSDKDAYYSLDYIVEAKLLERHFIPDKTQLRSEFYSQKVSKFFKADDADYVRLKAYGKTINYLRNKPLHKSQKEVITKKKYSEFILKLVGSDDDFIRELLWHASDIEVLEPDFLRKRMRTTTSKMFQRYPKKKSKQDEEWEISSGV